MLWELDDVVTTDISQVNNVPSHVEERPSHQMMPWLSGLNEDQHQAVTILDGPLLVLSGAGTGKTRVLTARIAQLIGTRTAMPWNILAVTFTNKAAREMKERVAAMVGPMAEQVMLGTFHSVAARMLRRHAELVGLTSSFTIIDTDDQLRLLKQVMEQQSIDPKRWQPRGLLGMISKWKDKGLTPDKVSLTEAGDVADGKIISIYKAYQARLISLNAADFGDLLLHLLTIFTSHQDILTEYQNRLTHILVDEYQDTNVAQYLWLRLLAAKHKNLCCVGDDDQSIYGWRGAEVGNILKFEKDYEGAQIVRLEENYRSTGHILACASALISHNETRLGKDLFTSSDKGDAVQISGYWDGNEEARSLSSQIEFLIKENHPLDQIAVLVRAGFQTREFEERFMAIGLPYRVVGTRFYERAEIRDALAYLRLIAQPSDDLAFERIINTPKRGLGPTSLKVIFEYARVSDQPYLAAARALVDSDELKPQARRQLSQFIAYIDQWRMLAQQQTASDLARFVLDDSGYTAMWQADKNPDSPGRLENLKELVTAMESFETLSGFLEHIALVTDTENNKQDGEVSLMTLHAAKGLEFDTVFLPGWEEGLFPSQRSLDENGGAGLEEERRLGYVGITRARKNLFVSFAANRRVHGLWQACIPSRFIAELPKQHINEDMAQGLTIGRSEPLMVGSADSRVGQAGYGPGWQRAANRKGQISSPAPQRDADGWVPQAGASGFAKGDRVFHQKFGMGNVASVEGDKLDIAFDRAGRKKVVASFVEKMGQS